MDTVAVVLREPKRIEVSRLDLTPAGNEDVVVKVEWSGISTGTERLLWSGRMPHFPGMGYPLVPGYESVGRVVEAGPQSGRRVGDCVFVPGARCYGDVRGLFGGAASTVVVPGARVLPVDDAWADRGVLLALAATAHHVTEGDVARQPDLIVGHGVLGRLLARMATAFGEHPPVVWETDATRSHGADGYTVIHPDDDERRDYRHIVDVSGDSDILDTLIARMAPGGEIALAGFYDTPLSFAFPPAFMREARIRIAAQWRDADLAGAKEAIETGRVSLDGLITHHAAASEAVAAYETAFNDNSCLKMVLDWREYA